MAMGDEDKSQERALKDVTDKLSGIEDLQNLTQLDIINMKNEVEKLKLVSSSPISPEAEERIAKLQNISKDVEMFKRWKETVDEVKFLRNKLMGPENAEPSAKPSEKITIDDLAESIEEIRAELKARKAGTVDLEDLKSAIEENRKAVENLKHMIAGKPRGAMPDVEPLKRMIGENRKLVKNVKARVEISNLDVPAGMRHEIESLHEEITKLEEEMKKGRNEPPSKRPKDEIDHLRSELFGKLDELNVKFGPKGSEEIRKAMEANKASIDKLKSLISGEEVDIDGLKREMEENRKFMAEIKGLLVSKKPKGSGKIAVPPDPELRDRMIKLEQRFDLLSRKMARMVELKPIRLPELPSLPARGKGAAKAMPGEAEGIKKEIDGIISRLDGFLTKDEVEKGFLEKRMKADEKLMTGEIYKDMNDIKKEILRNEDQITSVASDVERMKKEVGTVEKREWGKVSEITAMDDLKHRIDDLEKRLESTREGPVFIE
jgi:predicted  nucleic acid-binding Zn-ribbon protein